MFSFLSQSSQVKNIDIQNYASVYKSRKLIHWPIITISSALKRDGQRDWIKFCYVYKVNEVDEEYFN